jgi:hypothetical protein
MPLTWHVYQRGEYRRRDSIFGIFNVCPGDNGSHSGRHSQQAKSKTPFHLLIYLN